MIFNNIYSAVIICLFIAFIGIVISFYIDYRKNYRQVNQIYAILTNQQLLKKEDYQTWQNLGFWGFGFLTTILSRVLQGKRVRLTECRWLEPQSCNKFFSDFDLSWVKSYRRKILIATAIFLLLLILSSINSV